MKPFTAKTLVSIYSCMDPRAGSVNNYTMVCAGACDKYTYNQAIYSLVTRTCNTTLQGLTKLVVGEVI